MPRITGPTVPTTPTTDNSAAVHSDASARTIDLDLARDRLLPTLRGRRAAFHHRLPSNHRHNAGGSRRPTRRPAISKTMLDEGQTLKLGDRGPAVAHAQALLRKHGFRVGRTGYLGARTQLKILAFQKANDLKQTGALNPETYAALSKPPGRALTNPRGTALANAVKEAIKPNNTAFDNVLEAIDGTFGEFLYGNAPYMVPRQLNQHPDFREVKVPHASLKDLPAGSIVVWNRSLENPQGDITVALGDGQEAGGSIQPIGLGRDPELGFRTFIVT